MLPKWLTRVLRGTPAARPTVIDVARAIAFGDAADTVRTAERWAVRERERREQDEYAERAAASAKQIADAVKRDGWWTPESPRRPRW